MKKMKPSIENYICKVCSKILIEPIETPCLHEMCRLCFAKHVFAFGLSCPVCRKCITTKWLEAASNNNSLTNEKRWTQIKRSFLGEVHKRMADIIFEEPDPFLVRILGTPTEIRKQYLLELNKHDKNFTISKESYAITQNLAASKPTTDGAFQKVLDATDQPYSLRTRSAAAAASEPGSKFHMANDDTRKQDDSKTSIAHLIRPPIHQTKINDRSSFPIGHICSREVERRYSETEDDLPSVHSPDCMHDHGDAQDNRTDISEDAEMRKLENEIRANGDHTFRPINSALPTCYMSLLSDGLVEHFPVLVKPAMAPLLLDLNKTGTDISTSTTVRSPIILLEDCLSKSSSVGDISKIMATKINLNPVHNAKPTTDTQKQSRNKNQAKHGADDSGFFETSASTPGAYSRRSESPEKMKQSRKPEHDYYSLRSRRVPKVPL